jgi:hypothetical protein
MIGWRKGNLLYLCIEMRAGEAHPALDYSTPIARGK